MTDDFIRDFIFSLEPEIPEDLRVLEKTALEENVPIIRRGTQSLLRFIIRDRRPERILEVGTAVGFSASFMSYYAPKNVHIDTIEKVEMRIKEAKKNLRELIESGRVTLIEGDAFDVLRSLSGPYDLIFMDAAKAQYINYLPEIKRMMSKDTLLVTDNVLREDLTARSKYEISRRDRTTHIRMREYLYKIMHDTDLESTVIETGDGMALTRLRRTDE